LLLHNEKPYPKIYSTVSTLAASRNYTCAWLTDIATAGGPVTSALPSPAFLREIHEQPSNKHTNTRNRQRQGQLRGCDNFSHTMTGSQNKQRLFPYTI